MYTVLYNYNEYCHLFIIHVHNVYLHSQLVYSKPFAIGSKQFFCHDGGKAQY